MKTIFAMLACAAVALAGCSPADDVSRDAPPDVQPSTMASRTVAQLGEPYAPLVETTPWGQIDWTAGKLIGVGQGRANNDLPQQVALAQRGARLMAARNLALLAQNLPAGPGGEFRQLRNGTVNLDALVSDFEEISSAYDPATHTATVRLRMPIFGSRGLAGQGGLTLAPPARFYPGRQNASPLTQSRIVIDARGKFAPQCLPQVVSERGETVFDLTDLTPLQNLAGDTFTYARVTRNVALSPDTLVVRAAVSSRGQLVLGQRELSRLFPPADPAATAPAAAPTADALTLWRQNKVVILVDPPAKK